MAILTEKDVEQNLFDNKQNLSVTTYKYYRKLCAAASIKSDAKTIVKRIKARAK